MTKNRPVVSTTGPCFKNYDMDFITPGIITIIAVLFGLYVSKRIMKIIDDDAE